MARYKIGKFLPHNKFQENLIKFELDFSNLMLEIQEIGGNIESHSIRNYLNLLIEKDSEDYFLLVVDESSISNGSVTWISPLSGNSRNYFAFGQDNENQELNFIGSDDIRTHLDDINRYVVVDDIMDYLYNHSLLVAIPPNIPFQIDLIDMEENGMFLRIRK